MKFNEYTVGEIVSTVIDYRGKTPKKLGGDWSDNGYRALSAKNIKTGRIVQPETIRFVNAELYKKWMKEEIQKGDIIITSEAPLGQVYFWNSDEKIVLSQRLFAIRCNKAFYPNYIYQYMTTAAFQGELENRATGTTVMGLRQPELMKCLVYAPSFIEQKKIASILSALDDKIELNNKINENLEQQAQAIFKSWFVDFEPWGGVCPEDWEQGTFSKLISSTLGGDWGKETPTGNYSEKVYCIRGADIPDVKSGNKGKMPERFILPKNYENKKLKSNDIVVEISGGSPTQSTGRVAMISDALLGRYDKGMVCTNFCRAIKPVDGYSSFIYYYWQYLYNLNVFFTYENGTTGIKNLDIAGFLENEAIIIPDVESVQKFDSFCKSVFKQIFSNGLENEKLSTIRDNLLPKLMSGEIDVSEIEI